MSCIIRINISILAQSHGVIGCEHYLGRIVYRRIIIISLLRIDAQEIQRVHSGLEPIAPVVHQVYVIALATQHLCLVRKADTEAERDVVVDAECRPDDAISVIQAFSVDRLTNYPRPGSLFVWRADNSCDCCHQGLLGLFFGVRQNDVQATFELLIVIDRLLESFQEVFHCAGNYVTGNEKTWIHRTVIAVCILNNLLTITLLHQRRTMLSVHR